MIGLSLIILIILVLYSLLIWKLYLAWRGIPEYHISQNSRIFISVIVPFYNEERHIEQLISDLKSQEYPADQFQVILVDDYSDDSSFYKAESLCSEISNFNVIKNSYRKGKKYALKAAIDIAVGDYILLTDSDCRLPEKWIAAYGSFIADNADAILISSGVKLKETSSFSGKFQLLEFASLVASGAASFIQGSPLMCNAANLAFKKELFAEAFEFLHPDINTGDDMFLMLFAKKYYKERMKFLKSGSAFNQTFPAENWISLFRQRIRWSSKSVLYKDYHLIRVSILVFLINVSLMVLIGFSIIKPIWLIILLPAFILKSIPDFLLLHSFLKFSEQKGLMKFFFPTQIIYIIFIPLTAVMGFLFRVKACKLRI